MTGHTIVIGYGNIGRSAAHTIVDADLESDLVVDQVVVTSRLTGRLLGLSTRHPGLLAEFRHCLRQHPEVVVAERPTRVSEIGQHPRLCSPMILAVLRGNRISWRDDPQTSSLRAFDRLLVLRAQWPIR